jgi:hypothetical protein
MPSILNWDALAQDQKRLHLLSQTGRELASPLDLNDLSDSMVAELLMRCDLDDHGPELRDWLYTRMRGLLERWRDEVLAPKVLADACAPVPTDAGQEKNRTQPIAAVQGEVVSLHLSGKHTDWRVRGMRPSANHDRETYVFLIPATDGEIPTHTDEADSVPKQPVLLSLTWAAYIEAFRGRVEAAPESLKAAS